MCQYGWMTDTITPCCEPVAEARLDQAAAVQVASWFKVLSDPVRLRLLSMIASTDEACVCDLLEPAGVSQPTVSHHLKVLHEAGLLEREKRGRWVYYRAVPERLRVLADVLS